MKSPQVFFDIDLGELLEKANDYNQRGWRLADLCGSTVDGKVELIYSFTFDEQIENIRVLASNDDVVPALSPIYSGFFVFENEVHELYGVQFEGISIDFKGKFYTVSVPTPMNPASKAAQQYYADNASNEPAEASAEDNSPEQSTEGEATNG